MRDQEKKKKKRARAEWDDGRVIAPMTGEELPPYRRGMGGGSSADSKGAGGADPAPRSAPTQLSKKEERALTRALFLAMLPRLLVTLLAFGIVFLLGYLWLTQ